MNSSLMGDIGKDPNWQHKIAVKCCEYLMNQSRHIDMLVEKQTLQETENNWLRLNTSIDSVQWLAFQACAFRGHDERSYLKNQGNFIELIKLLATYNDDIVGLVLENAYKMPNMHHQKFKRKSYISLQIKCGTWLKKEIGDAKFCILVDEAQYESKREQITIILRFVDKYGVTREPFLHIVHVKDTIVSTLKNDMCCSFSLQPPNWIFETIDIMQVVICMVNGMGYKLYFLEIVLMPYY